MVFLQSNATISQSNTALEAALQRTKEQLAAETRARLELESINTSLTQQLEIMREQFALQSRTSSQHLNHLKAQSEEERRNLTEELREKTQSNDELKKVPHQDLIHFSSHCCERHTKH